MIIALFVVSLITFLKPERGLYIIILSMLLSPEISLGAVQGRDIVLRLEDLILVIVVITWLAQMAIKKDVGFFRKTPLNKAIGIYVAFNIISTVRGMLFDFVSPAKGFFFVLKYIEYFFLYFMVANQIRSKEQIKLFIQFFIFTCFVTCVYAVLHIGQGRLSTPFETGSGEPNTLGGYLLIVLSLIMGLFLYSPSSRSRMFLTCFSVFLIMPSFLFTLSRTSYLAIIPMWLSLIILGPRKRLMGSILLLAFGLGIFFMPQAVRERLEYTLKGRSQIKATVVAGVKLDPSSSARIESWKEAWKRVKKYPFLGYGVTGLFFIDGQYVRILGELGILGILAFLYLQWTIFKEGLKIFHQVQDPFFKSICLGFLGGFVGLLFFNIGANGYILTRIMEPFWFLAAIVFMLPTIRAQVAENEGDQGKRQRVLSSRSF